MGECSRRSFPKERQSMTDFADQIAQQAGGVTASSIEAFRAWLSSSLFPIDGAGHDVQSSSEVAQHGA